MEGHIVLEATMSNRTDREVGAQTVRDIPFVQMNGQFSGRNKYVAGGRSAAADRLTAASDRQEE